MNEAILEKKRNDYYAKKREEEKKQEDLAKIKEREELYKRLREQEKEQKIKDVLKKNEKLLESRKGELITKINSTDAKVQRAQRHFKAHMDAKKNIERLKSQDRLENVERIRQIQEYQRQQLLERIEKDNQRAIMIRQEQENIIAMRQKIRRDMDAQKEKLLKDFYARQKRQKSVAGNNYSDGTQSRAGDLFQPNSATNANSVRE